VGTTFFAARGQQLAYSDNGEDTRDLLNGVTYITS